MLLSGFLPDIKLPAVISYSWLILYDIYGETWNIEPKCYFFLLHLCKKSYYENGYFIFYKNRKQD